MTAWPISRAKHLYLAVDERAGERRPSLLAVSIHHGVVPRSSLTDDLPRAEDLSNYKLCRPGDIVLNRMRAFQGAIGHCHQIGLVSPDYLVLRPNADPRYLHHLFRSGWFVGEMKARLRGIGNAENGGVRTPRINREDLDEIRVAIPSLPEQEAIADYLDTETARIDSLIGKKRGLLDLFKQRINAWRYEAFAGIGRPTGIPSMPEVPLGWDVLRNKVVLREVNDPSPDGNGEMLSVSHLTGVTPRREKNVNMFEAESTVGYKRVRPGDLVINTMWAWMGAAGVSRYNGIVSPAYGVYRFRSNRVLPEFYDVLVRSQAYIDEMTRFSRGVTSSRLRLYPEEFLALSCPVPQVEVQERLAANYRDQVVRFETLDRQLSHQIDLLVERRQALITAAVTGDLEIPGVAS